MKIPEFQIQSLYQKFPYLINPDFISYNVEAQKHLDSGIADLVLVSPLEIVIVELKVVALNQTHALQLIEYLEDTEKQIKAENKIRGILIGFTPSDDYLNNTISNSQYSIEILILGEDVPYDIKFCPKCRLANDSKSKKCFNCNLDI